MHGIGYSGFLPNKTVHGIGPVDFCYFPDNVLSRFQCFVLLRPE